MHCTVKKTALPCKLHCTALHCKEYCTALIGILHCTERDTALHCKGNCTALHCNGYCTLLRMLHNTVKDPELLGCFPKTMISDLVSLLVLGLHIGRLRFFPVCGISSWNFERMLTPNHMSHVTYDMSCVMCQVSGVTCQVLRVRCHMSFFLLLLFFDKVVELVGGGSVINGAYPI